MSAFSVSDSSSASFSPVSFSFSLDDLRKTLPGAEALAGRSVDALKEAVTPGTTNWFFKLPT